MTLTQGIGCSVLITWELSLIFGPIVARIVQRVAVKTEQRNPHARRTGRGAFLSR